MALIDEVQIKVVSGAGGNGCRSFRREKYVPFGGPNGGDGGRGGHVYLSATRDKTSLLDFKFRPKYEGERGEHGMGSDMYGKAGDDLHLSVPVGTTVYDVETGEVVVDLVEHEQTVIIAKGGRGGLGNIHFKTSTNRAPRTSTPGELGEERELRLELRLLADVGLVGLPNAGKSSFLTAVSRARPKIADYPFTTLEPHLGVVSHKDQGFVVGDLPGLIEGASAGVGLGIKFLKHVSRNRVLLHLVESTSDAESIHAQVDVIEKELEAFDPELINRKRLLVFTKIDLFPPEELEVRKAALAKKGLTGFWISSHARHGIPELLDCLIEEIKVSVEAEKAAKAIADAEAAVAAAKKAAAIAAGEEVAGTEIPTARRPSRKRIPIREEAAH